MTKSAATIQPQEWPTSNQERQMWCVRHVTETPTYPDVARLHAWTPTDDVVALRIEDPTEHAEAATFLRSHGFVVLHDEGCDLAYA